MPTTDLTPGTITTLGQLRPGDVFEFIYRSTWNERLLCVVTRSGPTSSSTRYQDIRRPNEEDCIQNDTRIIFHGRGRIEPARIVMDGEPDRAAELEAGLPWTDAKPTVPGWYWYRDEIGDHKDSWGMLKYPGGETIFYEGFSHPLDEFAGQFAGPIPTPKDRP